MALPLLVGLLGAVWSQPVVAQRWDNCTSTGKGSDIPGCSAVIEKNEHSCSVLAVALANRGLAHVKKGNLSEALDDYDLSIKLNSRYAGAYLGRSEVLFRMGKTGPATIDEKKGSRLLTEAQTAYDEGYQAYWDSKFGLAIERYTDAIEMDPLFAYAYYGRADVHYYRENWSQAAEDYEVAVRLMSPKDVWFESGNRHLKFSRLYARQSGTKEIGRSSGDGCAVLRDLMPGTNSSEPKIAQSPSDTVPGTQSSPPPDGENPPPSIYPRPDEPGPGPSSGTEPIVPTEPQPDSPASPPQVPPSEPTPPPTEPGYSAGTGFFVTMDGYLITNAHVVRGCREAVVTLEDRRITQAAIVIVNPLVDLALLRTQVSPAAAAKFRTSPPLKQGTDIVVFGFPRLDLLSWTGNAVTGNVAALAGPSEAALFIQISAPVQPGNSGGPVMDRNGNVVGVVTAKLNDVEQANLAINSDVARLFLEAAGVVYVTATSDPRSAYPDTADLAELARKFTVPIVCSVEQ